MNSLMGLGLYRKCTQSSQRIRFLQFKSELSLIIRRVSLLLVSKSDRNIFMGFHNRLQSER